MKILLASLLVLLFLLTGCQTEINEEIVELPEEAEINEEIVELPEEDVAPVEERSDYLFSLFGASQKEILDLFEEVPQLVSEEETAGIEIENASVLIYPEENIVFFFSEERMVEIFLPAGNIFLGFEIKEVLDEEAAIHLFGEPDERIFFRDRDCLVYYMDGADVHFVKETDTFRAHVSIFLPHSYHQ